MKISTNWIKDYIEIDNLSSLADKITNAGVNVQAINTKYIPNLVIAKVLEVKKHPDSDHLNICQVDTGNGVLQIVCGASNVKENIKVILAKVGAILPGDFEIKKSSIRGVESEGMICALYELGVEEYTKEAYDKGIHIVSDDIPVGLDGSKYLNLDDTIYELDLNPNRNDCLSHLGFAYEVGAVLNKKVNLPNIEYQKYPSTYNYSFDIQTDNVYLYLNKIVKDITIKESPDFIKERLLSVGIRPINNIVDISNYVMLEYGQPMHFYDKDKVGDKLIIKMGNEQEEITTIDNKVRKLNNSDIVIYNNKPICLAGIMGGSNTEVNSETKNLLIESAIFNPYNIRYTSINLDLRSESSLRGEKKLNPEYTYLALERACHLLEKYADAKVEEKLYEYKKIENKIQTISLSLEDINSLLGLNISLEDVSKILEALDFKYEIKNKIYVEIPLRRQDIEPHKEDIIEEIGRLYGYINIPNKMPKISLKAGSYKGNIKTRKNISKYMRSLGLNEVRTYTLVSLEEDNFSFPTESIKLLRPLTNDKQVIRRSLIPSLLKVVDYNNARNYNDINIYEIANTYYDEDKEEMKLCIMLKGSFLKHKWSNTNINNNFYVLKGMIVSLLDYLGLKNRYTFEKGEICNFHPGISAKIMIDHKEVGYFGKLHPKYRKDDIYTLEISLTKLFNYKAKALKWEELSKYPVVNKDLAFKMPNDVTADDLKIILKKSSNLVTNIEVFDVYQNEDFKSYAFTISLSDKTRTLNDEEINNVLKTMITNVENKTSARLRQ